MSAAAKINLINGFVKNGIRTNLSIDVRTDWAVYFIYLDENGVAPSGMASWTMTCEIRNDAGTLIATPTCTVTNASTGAWTLSLTDAETTGLTPGTYNYDVLVNDAGTIFKLQYGDAQIVDTVTQ